MPVHSERDAANRSYEVIFFTDDSQYFVPIIFPDWAATSKENLDYWMKNRLLSQLPWDDEVDEFLSARGE